VRVRAGKGAYSLISVPNYGGDLVFLTFTNFYLCQICGKEKICRKVIVKG
jgi:hypothetical protein